MPSSKAELMLTWLQGLFQLVEEPLSQNTTREGSWKLSTHMAVKKLSVGLEKMLRTSLELSFKNVEK